MLVRIPLDTYLQLHEVTSRWLASFCFQRTDCRIWTDGNAAVRTRQVRESFEELQHKIFATQRCGMIDVLLASAQVGVGRVDS